MTVTITEQTVNIETTISRPAITIGDQAISVETTPGLAAVAVAEQAVSVAASSPSGAAIEVDSVSVAVSVSSGVSGGGTPGGADTQVQFNDAGAFGGDAGLTYDKTIQQLTTPQTLIQGSANHDATLSAELLPNPSLIDNMDGWSGVGWTWEFFAPDECGSIFHDPLETAPLITDDPLVNTEELVLFTFFITGQTQGAIGISLQPAPYSGATFGNDNYTIITGNGQYVIALFSATDDVHLVIDPLPLGFSDVFDGRFEPLFSAKRIDRSEPVLLSKLANGEPSSIRMHLTNTSSTLIGFDTGSGMSADSTSDNNAVGSAAMEAAWQARSNAATGSDTIRYGADAQDCVAIGASALRRGQKARYSIAIGQQSLLSAAQPTNITAIGDRTLSGLITGNELTVIGAQAAYNMIHGVGNVVIGAGAGGDLVDTHYQLRIGHYISGPESLIAGDFVAKTLTIGGDLDFYSATEGTILTDRTTADRYRLFVDNGVLGIEVVV